MPYRVTWTQSKSGDYTVRIYHIGRDYDKQVLKATGLSYYQADEIFSKAESIIQEEEFNKEV